MGSLSKVLPHLNRKLHFTWRFYAVYALLLAPLLAGLSFAVLPSPDASAAPIHLGPYPIEYFGGAGNGGTTIRVEYTIYQPGDAIPGSSNICPKARTNGRVELPNVWCYTYIVSNDINSANTINQFQSRLGAGVTVYNLGYDTTDNVNTRPAPGFTITNAGTNFPVIIRGDDNTQYQFNGNTGTIPVGGRSTILYFEANKPPGAGNGTFSISGGSSANGILPGFSPLAAIIAAQTKPIPSVNPTAIGTGSGISPNTPEYALTISNGSCGGTPCENPSLYAYTIFFTNPLTDSNGNPNTTTLHGVQVTNFLPTGITALPLSPSNQVDYTGTTATNPTGTDTVNPSNQTFKNWDVAPGQQIEITFNVQAAPNLPIGTVFYIKPLSKFKFTTDTATGALSLPDQGPGVYYTGPQAYDVYNTTPQNPTNGCDPTIANGTNACNNLAAGYNNIASTAAPVIIEPNAVRLTSTKAGLATSAKGVEIQWKTNFETKNAGFYVYRSDKKDGIYTKISKLIAPVHTLNSIGVSNYTYVDTTGKPGNWYRIEDVDLQGRVTAQSAFQAVNAALPVTTVSNTPKLPVHTAKAASSVGVVNKLKFFTAADGVYRISYSDLQAAGLNLTNVKGSQAHIVGNGKSIQVTTNTSDALNSGSYFEFYGQANKSEYSSETAYFLSFDGTGPAVNLLGASKSLTRANIAGASQVKSYLATSHFQQNNYYLANLADEHAWGWDYVTDADSSSNTKDLGFDLSALPANSTSTVTISGVLAGATSAAHTASLAVNGHAVGSLISWSGDNSQSFTVSFPQSYLSEGANSLTFKTNVDPKTFDAVVMEYFDVSYNRLPRATNNQLTVTVPANASLLANGFTDSQLAVYDISDPTQPQRLTLPTVKTDDGSYGVYLSKSIPIRPQLVRPGALRPHTYYIAGNSLTTSVSAMAADSPLDLRAAANSADMIIVSYSGFMDQAQDLANFHKAQGTNTLAVSVDDVYDNFSNGNATPQAIKDFLAYAHANWKAPATKWVLLLGGGTYNYKGYTGPDLASSGASLVPAHYFRSESYHTRTISDNWFVAGADGLTPFMSIGRLPAQTQAEAINAVNNIKAYVSNASTGAFNPQVSFVSDVLDASGNKMPANSNSFANDSNTIKGGLPASVKTSTYYDGNTGDGVTALNAGPSVLNYVGHGGYEEWSLNNILQSSDAAASGGKLTNANQRALVVQLTCFTGDYGIVNDSLAWQMVSDPNGGAIASLAASSWTDEGPDVNVGKAFYAQLFGNTRLTIGEATQNSMHNLMAQGNYSDTVQTYNLIGDPALYLLR